MAAKRASMKTQSQLVVCILCFIFCPQLVKADAPQYVQILHTNDLHGFLENSVTDPKRGNYAALKAKMDHLEQLALNKDIPTLRLDAGDFLEGNMFYLAEKGRRVWNIMKLMDYDAITVGNHDWLMGTGELEKLLEESPPNFAYLGANFVVRNPLYQTVKNTVRPYTSFEFYGKKIAIMGLTTDELFYSWRFNGGSIKEPEETARLLEMRLKGKGIDKLIALTHTGAYTDQKVVKKTEYLDLVIGGHSHTELFKPIYQSNKLGRKIPIVQTGSHGRWLGKLLLDISKDEGVEVVSYELVPVYSLAQRDPIVDTFTKTSREILNRDYGEEYLSEVIGHTEIPLSSSVSRITPWSKLVTDALREATGAEISVHSPGFGGATIMPGPVTREMVFNTYPRVFELEDRYGWYVWEVEVYGVVLKSILRLVLKTQQPAIFSGISFNLVDRNNEVLKIDPFTLVGGRESGVDNPFRLINRYLGIDANFRVENIKIDGKGINPFRKYRMALPEGIVVGGVGISQVVNYLLRHGNRSKATIWDAMNQKVEKMKVIRGHLTDEASKRRSVLERLRR